MASSEVSVDVRRLFAESAAMKVTLKVKGARRLRFRIRCAIPLLRLAAAVAGMGIEVDLTSGQK